LPDEKAGLSDIAHGCGVIEALYYSTTHLHFVGERDHPQQATRKQLMTVASAVIDAEIEEKLRELKAMIERYLDGTEK
jgi:hypothetical protein